jgi:hypothetical protein
VIVCDSGHAAASPPGMRSPHGRLLDQQAHIATMAKRAAPLKTHSQQACEAGDLAEYGLGGTAGSRGGPRRGQGRRRGAKLAQSPWMPLSIGLRSYRSIWSQVQFLPFPCGEGERGTAWTMT